MNTKRAQTSEKGFWFHGTLIHMPWQLIGIKEVGTKGLNLHLSGSTRIERENKRREKNGPAFLQPGRHGNRLRLKELGQRKERHG